MSYRYLPLRIWHEAVGPRVARETRPSLMVRDGVLVVEVAPEWLGEVLPMSQGILDNLHALGHADVEILEWRQDQSEGAA